MEESGRKYDQGKLRWDLFPFEEAQDIVKVLMYGADKYGEDPDQPNWKKMVDGKRRYFAAAMRHMVAWKSGEENDPETGISHLAHAATNLMFMLYFKENG